MNTHLNILLISALILGSSCASIEPGHDPLVVRAEQTAAGALEIFDGYLLIEHTHRETLAGISQEFREVADRIRTDGPGMLTSLRNATQAYKQSREAEDQEELVIAISLVNTLLREAQVWLARAQQEITT